MVPRAGLEPATLGLEVLCSIQLSYRGVKLVYGFLGNDAREAAEIFDDIRW